MKAQMLQNRLPKTLFFDEEAGALIILDQTLLPVKEEYVSLYSVREVCEAIVRLMVRGAPAIGLAAAYGLVLAIRNRPFPNASALTDEFMKASRRLAQTRPTAVNLFWALNRMEKALNRLQNLPVEEITAQLLREAADMQREDTETCKKIGEEGLKFLRPDMGILTICNAGSLAASAYGTALAPIYLGHEQHYNFRMYACETRPLLQGARLTAWELQRAGIDVTLLCDNMASYLMQQQKIDAVVAGADRIAANGDTANKIGTSGLAVLAKHYGIPFYILAPSTTLDPACPTGSSIVIEERDATEITQKWYARPMAPAGIKTINPAFDVTPGSLITQIITEKGPFIANT